MKSDETGNSANLAMWYKDVPIQADVLKTLEGKITEACRRYLIGKLCIAEKNKRGTEEHICDVFERIGNDFGYVRNSLKRLVNYVNAIDRIQRLLPETALDILNGKVRLSVPNTILLSRMELPDICNILERLSNETIPTWIIIEEQKMFQKKPKRRGRPRKVITEDTVSVKDMPSYNPDANVNGLTYTIPSWINMIERVFTASEFSEVSKEARNRLTIELNKLTSAAETVAAVLSEVK